MYNFMNIADIVLGLAIIAGIPVYPLLQLWAAKTLPSRWRFAAMAPLALGTILLARTLAALVGDAGLSLVPLIFFAPAAVLYLLGIFGVRAVVSAKTK
jgi:hypothetical protein